MYGRSKRVARLGRRRFLRLTSAGLVYGLMAKPLAASSIYLPMVQKRVEVGILPVSEQVAAASSTYTVGIGHHHDPYTATMRALDASGELTSDAVGGRTVVIKPNLVGGKTAETGSTTDPQVVRALVDRVLAAGAAEVKIVEGFALVDQFDACGYRFFDTYDPQGRVSLVDLRGQPQRLVDVPEGTAYRKLFLPELILDPNTYLISAAKLKCHAESVATLSLKNSFGLPPENRYRLPQPGAVWRFAMHERGMHQTVLDINMARPIDFAVVDGIWAMEGRGPVNGNPVKMDTVIAGRNALAVDRVSLALMDIDPDRVLHVTYAALRGLGPRALSEVVVQGDAVTPRPFALPPTPPLITYPTAFPLLFAPSKGQRTTVGFLLERPAPTRISIIQVSEVSTEVIHVRQLQDWSVRRAGVNLITWNGRNDDGAQVSPGLYKVQVEATAAQVARNSFATGWVGVV